MIFDFNLPLNCRKSGKSNRSAFVLFLFLSINSLFLAQNPIAEVYSGRIQNSLSGNLFYFRILDVNQAEFDNYSKISKDFVLFNNYKSGYSPEYKIGSLYYSSQNSFNLNSIQSLLKQLGFSKVKYDDKFINVSELPNHPIITPEHLPNNNSRQK
ncbi:MAG: hypothetical protein Q7W45_18045 [Bacteroidota bacterium]|nr:hypothetical protein [Bacteroidota bacterium]MDP3146346.1 hypothetical protein [Bacteroidota bacterium]